MLSYGRGERSNGIAVLIVVLGCLGWVGSAFGAGDENAGTCPGAEASPGFRAFMADCRAYELVSPVYGGGAAAKIRAVSADGERVIVNSTTGFVGNEDLEDSEGETGSYYALTRTSAGWSAESLNPPTALFSRMHYFHIASTDLSRVLYEVSPSSGNGEVNLPERYVGWNLAVREPAGGGAGRFTVLGPMLAPGYEPGGSNQYEHVEDFILGASADLSHVFFLVRAERKQTWPGDQTAEGDQSLYEYALGEGKEPQLVGISNTGPLEGSPSVNDGAALLSDCGTAFDGVTGTGEAEAVYFTALHVEGCSASQPPVDELYARVDGSRTVKISGSEPATFDGASADGAKVFFSEDGKLYEYIIAEAKTVLLTSSITGKPLISQDGGRVYFSSPEVLTSDAEPNGNGEAASETAGEKLYVVDTQAGLAFVAGEASASQTTHDGAYLLLGSARDLRGTNDHSSPVGQLFEYQALTGKVARVSVGQKSAAGYECPTTKAIEAGYNCDGNTENFGYEPLTQGFSRIDAELFTKLISDTAQPEAPATDRAIAENGAVVFRSDLALTPQATPGAPNAYEYREGQVDLITPVLAEVYGFDNPMIDESGRDVFFSTLEGLVPQDTDGQASVYDSRSEGGFPAPPATPSCSGEACQGPAGAPSAFGSPGSTVVGPSGNLTPPVEPTPAAKPITTVKRCKKGYTKHKGKCAKTRSTKKKT